MLDTGFRFCTGNVIQLGKLLTPFGIGQTLTNAKSALQQQWLDLNLVDTNLLGHNLSTLPGSAKWRTQHHIPAVVEVFGGVLNLRNANLIHSNVRCTLKSQVNIPIGLAVTQKSKSAISH